MDVRRKDLGAVGEVIRSVCAVVVDDDDVYGAVEEWPDGVVLECFTAIDEVELCLCGHEAGVVVIVEWIGIDGVFVASRS